MKRVPVIPTILVGLAVAAMIALGIWQLQRRTWKEGMLRQYAANHMLPAMAFPKIPVGDQYLFRKASAYCLKPVSWQREAGRDRQGNVGWRQSARCATGAEGPGITVQIGISSDANWKPDWKGGPVSGFVSHAPSALPAIAALFGKRAPQELMLVTDTPAPGLTANGLADTSGVPNNHLAYAVQWFIFAGLAGGIYALALYWRRKPTPSTTSPSRERD